MSKKPHVRSARELGWPLTFLAIVLWLVWTILSAPGCIKVVDNTKTEPKTGLAAAIIAVAKAAQADVQPAPDPEPGPPKPGEQCPCLDTACPFKAPDCGAVCPWCNGDGKVDAPGETPKTDPCDCDCDGEEPPAFEFMEPEIERSVEEYLGIYFRNQAAVNEIWLLPANEDMTLLDAIKAWEAAGCPGPTIAPDGEWPFFDDTPPAVEPSEPEPEPEKQEEKILVDEPEAAPPESGRYIPNKEYNRGVETKIVLP